MAGKLRDQGTELQRVAKVASNAATTEDTARIALKLNSFQSQIQANNDAANRQIAILFSNGHDSITWLQALREQVLSSHVAL